MAGLVIGAGGTAAQAESLEWEFPTELAPAAAEVASTAFHVDPAGGSYAAWAGFRLAPDQPAIWIRRKPAGSDWSVAELVTHQERGMIGELELSTDARGFLHLVWAGSTGADSDIFHSVRGRSGGWSEPRVVNDDRAGAPQEAPRAAADLWGNVHVVWIDHRLGRGELYHARIGADGQPGANVRVVEAGDQAEPALAVTSGGDLHAAWADTASGLPVIRTSLIPHAGFGPDVADGQMVWWPPATLSTGTDRQSRPTLLPGTHQTLTAAWVDAHRRVRAARLTPASPYWEAEREVYAAGGAEIGTLVGTTDLAGRAYLAWEESDPGGGRRVMAGSLPDDGPVQAARADYSPLSTQGHSPRLAANAASLVSLLWSGSGRDRQPALFARDATLPNAPFPTVAHEGWLQYLPSRMSCPGDGYLIAGCGGETGPFVTGKIDPRFVGRWVRVEGSLVEGVRCPMLLVSRVVLSTTPCPRREGAITGVITAAGTPVEGATVRLGSSEATTGRSGRFFLGAVSGGQHVITATSRCALTAAAAVQVQPEFTTVTTDADLVRADVQEDCAIDLMDLVRVTLAYHADPPFHPPCADLNEDAMIDVRDVAAVASAYDGACPAPWRAPGSAGYAPAGTGPAARRAQLPRAEWADPGDAPADVEHGAGANLVYRGPGPLVAWAVRVETRAPAARFEGAQPFAPAPGVWVVENTSAAGDALIAAAQLGARLADGAVLARLPGVDSRTIRVAEFALAGTGGADVAGWVDIENAAPCGAPGCARLFLPWTPHLRR